MQMILRILPSNGFKVYSEILCFQLPVDILLLSSAKNIRKMASYLGNTIFDADFLS